MDHGLRVVLALFILLAPSRLFAETANDNFTDTNGTLLTSHTSDSGHSWTLAPTESGNGEIQNNQCEDQNGNSPILYISAVPASADYSVQCDVDGAGDCGGPSGRITTVTVSDNYHVQWNNGTSLWRLRKRISGSSTILATDGTDDPASAAVTVKLTMTGTTIAFSTNGTQRGSVTDTAITDAGRGGIRFTGVTTDNIDNWSTIESAVTAVPTLTILGVGQ